MCTGLSKTAVTPIGIRSRRFTPPCAVTVSIWSLLSGASCIRPSGNIAGQICRGNTYRDCCRTKPLLVDRSPPPSIITAAVDPAALSCASATFAPVSALRLMSSASPTVIASANTVAKHISKTINFVDATKTLLCPLRLFLIIPPLKSNFPCVTLKFLENSLFLPHVYAHSRAHTHDILMQIDFTTSPTPLSTPYPKSPSRPPPFNLSPCPMGQTGTG